jgi:hypothetical protein
MPDGTGIFSATRANNRLKLYQSPTALPGDVIILPLYFEHGQNRNWAVRTHDSPRKLG